MACYAFSDPVRVSRAHLRIPQQPQQPFFATSVLIYYDIPLGYFLQGFLSRGRCLLCDGLRAQPRQLLLQCIITGREGAFRIAPLTSTASRALPVSSNLRPPFTSRLPPSEGFPGQAPVDNVGYFLPFPFLDVSSARLPLRGVAATSVAARHLCSFRSPHRLSNVYSGLSPIWVSTFSFYTERNADPYSRRERGVGN